MPEAYGQPPNPLRVFTLVHQLQEQFGPQEFGQIMQTFVALAFQKSGFRVVKNSVGVPDIQAVTADGLTGIAVEVKTGETTITLSSRDLEGVIRTGRVPVVAAFFLSDPRPRWILVDARSLRPITYRRHELASRQPASVSFDIDEAFSRIVVDTFTTAAEGPTALARLLDA